MDAVVNRREQEFLEKLAQKLGRPIPKDNPARTVAGPPDFWKNIRMSEEELCKQFTANAERLTVKTRLADTRAEMRAQLSEWLAEVKASSAICWDSPQLREASLPDLCKALGLKLVLWNHEAERNKMIQQCAEVDVGITWADYGIANTGSLAILSNPVQSRSVSLLPPVHIAILKRADILPHMGDVFRRLDQANLPSSLTFITGPSRTSDIEMDLTLGVHGPGKVFILIMDETE